MIDRLDREFGVKQSALNLRAYRQELLASNIANADTPYFKARDIDFKSAFQNVMSGRNTGSVELARTSSAHIQGQSDGQFDPQAQYRTEYQGAVDGNTVNIDVERGAFAENSIHMEALLTFLKDSIKEMQTAIQGQ
ncbi:flagellar basal body rod protein FlgB [Denitratisoma sp. agr-D3]